LASLREIFILQHNLSSHAKSQNKRQVRSISFQASNFNHDRNLLPELKPSGIALAETVKDCRFGSESEAAEGLE
jgi:hypothetical protein